MAAICERTLAEDFQQRHPMPQKRFSFDAEGGYACVGEGVFAEVPRGAWWTVPFLRFGAFGNTLFPDHGNNIPFTIENYPSIDGFGRPTITFIRTLDTPGTFMGRTKKGRFAAAMVYSEARGAVVEHLGTRQYLATDLVLEVLADGSLHLQTTGQRFYEGPVPFSFPGTSTSNRSEKKSVNSVRGDTP